MKREQSWKANADAIAANAASAAASELEAAVAEANDNARDAVLKANSTSAAVSSLAAVVAAASLFTQTGTGAVQRTVDSKLKDVVSIKDFGVVGDGVANDREKLRAAITACASRKIRLVIDAPIFIDTNFEPTNTIFVPSDSELAFTGAGKFIVNQTAVPVFCLELAKNIKWIDPIFEYIGTVPQNINTSPFSGKASLFSDSVRGTYIRQLLGITVSGNPSWHGPAAFMCILAIFGTQNVRLIRPHFFTRFPTDATRFIPWAIKVEPETLPVLVKSSDLVIEDPVFDGVIMGVQGNCDRLTMTNCRSYAYSDVQGPNGENYGGVNSYFPPPHLLYVDTPQGVIKNTIDYGIYVGSSLRRSTVSGFANSLKISGSDVVVDGYVSYRPDGVGDFSSSTNCSYLGIKGSYNSSVQYPIFVSTGTQFPSVRLLGPLNNCILDIDCIDTATTSYYMPISAGVGSDSRFKIKMKINNWNAAGDWPAWGPSNGGGHTIDMDIDYGTYSATQQFRGPVRFQGIPVSTKPIKVNCTVRGFRTITDSSFHATKPRIATAAENTTAAHEVTLYDLSNGLTANVYANSLREDILSRGNVVTIPSGAGPVNTGVFIPTGFEVFSIMATVTTTLGNSGELTTWSVGWSGTLSGFFAGIARSLNSIATSTATFAATTATREIVISPDAGTFDGTGVVLLEVRMRAFTRV